MPIPLLTLLALLIAGAACAEPKCPPDYVLTMGRCKRCPPGTESHDDQCVGGEGGVIVSPAEASDASGTTPAVPGGGGQEPVGGTNVMNGQDGGPPITAAPNNDAHVARSNDAGVGANDPGASAIEGGGPQADPCRGISQCVACTNDGHCPEPGACMVKHCNTSKGICEPGFAAAQSACGSSRCDGAGKCVGCLSDSDCGEPGECKIRYCNPSTRVCEPKNAPSTTSCPTGHCEQGMCVQCSAAADCADQTCQTKSCVSGQCRYANVPAGQRGACTTGVCTASQQCRECAGDEQCTRMNGDCATGRCVSNACRAEPKTGTCGPLKMCSPAGVCEDSCGNRSVDTAAGENCDPTAPSFNSWTCNSQTCRTTDLGATAYRTACSSASQCARNEICVSSLIYGAMGTQALPVCLPSCDGTTCRTVPGYQLISRGNASSSVCAPNNPCYVSCGPSQSPNQGCPPGTACIANVGVCGGPFN